jgi:hypothetical protein
LLRSRSGDDGGGDLVRRGRKTSPGSRSGGLWRSRGHRNGCSLGGRWGGCRHGCGRLLGLGGLLCWRFGLLGGLLLNSCRCLLRCGLLNLLWNLLGRGGRRNLFDRWVLLCNLLQLIVHLVQGFLAGRGLVTLVEIGILRDSSGGSGLGDSIGGGRLLLVVLLLGLLDEVTEDVVENKVAVGLFGENEGLDEAPVWLALVRDLANDLDDNVCIRALRIDVGDADFGVLELQFLDALVDGLEDC